MTFPVIACIAMAACCAYAGTMHLFIFVKIREHREELWFSIYAYIIGFYELTCVGLYTSGSLADGVFWQRIQLGLLPFGMLPMILIFGEILGKKWSRLMRILLTVCASLIPLILIPDGPLTLSVENPSIKVIPLPGGTMITYWESKPGLIFSAATTLQVFVMLGLLILLMFDHAKTRAKGKLALLVCQGCYFTGIVHDLLIVEGIWQSFYIAEYTSMVIVLMLAYLLVGRFAGINRELASLASGLEEKVAKRTEEISELNALLKDKAEHDALTGAYNRRFFDEYFSVEVHRAKRYEMEDVLSADELCKKSVNFGLAIIDIDDFKTINDTWGHAMGDQALTGLVSVVKGVLFERDVLCRYGGDEFAVLFTRTTPEGIAAAAEKLRSSVAGYELSGGVRMTISVGLAVYGRDYQGSTEAFIALADARLLAAKAQGKNRVVGPAPML